MTAKLDRLAGAAGLGYVVLAGVENMELLRAPLPGASASEIRAAYADGALAAATCAAGAISLLLYAAFAIALTRGAGPRPRHRRAALLAGIGGPLVALAAIVVSMPLVAGADMSDAGVESAFELQWTLRMLAGPLLALFLCCLGSRVARAVAVPLALAPVLPPEVALVAFSLNALVIWAWSLRLLLGRAELVRRAAFLMLVVAAGAVGVALLALPGATASFFAWELAPESLAAFAGGVYVGSAALYAAGVRASRSEARPLVAGAVVLSVSVLAITLLHIDKFDLGRLQAWAWLVLFAGFAATTGALLVTGERPARGHGAAGLDAGAARGGLRCADGDRDRALDRTRRPRPLGGRFAGSWTVMLGFLAGWAAVANRREEARLPALALIALPAGALLGAVRTLEADPAYVAGLALLIACGLAVLRASDESRSVQGSTGHVHQHEGIQRLRRARHRRRPRVLRRRPRAADLRGARPADAAHRG